jgi:hypothetical protein
VAPACLRPDRPPGLRGGDHEALVARLEAGGIDVVSNDVPAAGIRQPFLHDPNGVRIELNVR